MSERAMVWFAVAGAVLLGLVLLVWCLAVLARRRRPLARAVLRAQRQAEAAERLRAELDATRERARLLSVEASSAGARVSQLRR